MSELQATLLFGWELDSLPEYSFTLPSGTELGKRWKRNVRWQTPKAPPEWYMGEYWDDGTPGVVAIRWSKVELLHGPEPVPYDLEEVMNQVMRS